MSMAEAIVLIVVVLAGTVAAVTQWWHWRGEDEIDRLPPVRYDGRWR